MEDMMRKITVAAEARRSDDLLIIARTDSRTSMGIEEAIRRGQAYAKAGADIIFIESPESESEIIMAAEQIRAPLLANMVNGGRTPLLSAERLAEIGYGIAIHPAIGFLAAGAALRSAYADLLENGQTSDGIELYPFGDFSKLLGFEEVWDFERKFNELT